MGTPPSALQKCPAEKREKNMYHAHTSTHACPVAEVKRIINQLEEKNLSISTKNSC
jgi:hypothetical protein